jgi:ribonuclease R
MNRSQPWKFQKRKHGKPDGSGAPRSHVPGKQGHKPAPAPHKGPYEEVEGTLQLKGNFGFVLSENPKLGDVMVSGPTLKTAMGGDRVRARVMSAPEAPRRSGEIIAVLTHSRSTVVGAFRRMGNLPVVAPEDEGPLVHLTDLGTHVPHVGDIVTAKIMSWATDQKPAQGVLQEVIGPRDAPGVDLQTLIRKYELPDAFPPEAAIEAEAFGAEVPEKAWQSRQTFF